MGSGEDSLSSPIRANKDTANLSVWEESRDTELEEGREERNEKGEENGKKD